MSLLSDLEYTQKCVKDARQEERERLRPLLERCIEPIDAYREKIDCRLRADLDALLADLRRELKGKR